MTFAETAGLPTYSPDAEDADWTKFTWDWPPYRSAKFFEAIGGIDALEDFKESPAYLAAVERGLIHDDEWVLDWCTPDFGIHHDPQEPHEPGKPRRGVHVHIHRPTR